jgi:peptide/nickel transport system permease protein
VRSLRLLLSSADQMRYIAQRIILLVGTLIGVLTVTFFLTRILPGSPEAMILGRKPTAEQIAALRQELGLDQSLFWQYIRFVGEIVQGKFGTSFLTNQPVLKDIGERLMATVELTTLAMLAIIIIGIPVGVLSAVKANKPIDHVVRTASVLGVALPSFMLGMMLQMLFYGYLRWLPLQGRMTSTVLLDHPFPQVTGLYLVDTLLAGDMVAFWDAAAHIVLPMATLTLALLPIIARTTRNLMVEVLSEEYIRTNFAYGLPRRQIYFRYALKATLIPLLTVIGLTYGYMLGGAIVAEYVFDWPGIGSYVVRAIIQSDYPAAIGVTVFIAAAYLIINLLVDLLYFVVDPRLRTS